MLKLLKKSSLKVKILLLTNKNVKLPVKKLVKLLINTIIKI